MQNVLEAPAINTYFNSSTFSLPAFLQELYDGAASRGMNGADKDAWQCLDCVKKLIETEKISWWLDRKRAGENYVYPICIGMSG